VVVRLRLTASSHQTQSSSHVTWHSAPHQITYIMLTLSSFLQIIIASSPPHTHAFHRMPHTLSLYIVHPYCFFLCFVNRASRYMRVMKRTDALFIFSLFSHYTSTCFGLASSPSSGGNSVYMQQLVRVVRLSRLWAGHEAMKINSVSVRFITRVCILNCLQRIVSLWHRDKAADFQICAVTHVHACRHNGSYSVGDMSLSQLLWLVLRWGRYFRLRYSVVGR
jgi:hypothetical protein